MNPFLNKQCRNYSSHQEAALNSVEIEAQLKFIPSWYFDQKNTLLTRLFSFADYYKTIAFVNAVASIAHKQDHHPQLRVTYDRCEISFSTHSVGGVTNNDFICAAAIDILVTQNTE